MCGSSVGVGLGSVDCISLEKSRQEFVPPTG